MSAQPQEYLHERWQIHAECLGANPEIFFLEKGGSTLEAKAICAMCHVQDECLELGIAGVERYGIWGGRTERELRSIRLRRRVDAINTRRA